ncbi:MAG TPA: histidine kinase [Thermoanaerobaculia bacterium]|jgi:signal transduction histidine kinase
MDSGPLQSGRGERTIAAGRLMLAVFAFVALELDRELAAAPLRLFVGCAVVYAVALAIAAWRAPLRVAAARMLLHASDFLLFSALIQITHASVSPFFVFFLFSLFSAMLRFGVRGTLLTAGAAILTYVTMALFDERMRAEPGYLIVRVAALSVITMLLVYIGAFHERVREELARLASWPRGHAEERRPLVVETLALAADVLHVPRALLVWDEGEEEPWVWAALHDGAETALTREPPELAETLVAAPLRESTFLWRDAAREAVVLRGDAPPPRIEALSPPARERFRITSALSTPLRGETVEGRLFFLDRTDFSFDDVALAELVSRLAATRIDQWNVSERVRRAAVGEERIRVARDLHDGLLQSLTGVALQLEAIHRMLDDGDVDLRERLRGVQELIASDQRELRELITDLRPRSAPSRTAALGPRLAELAQRFRRQWDVDVEVSVEPPYPTLPDDVAAEIYSIVSEGVANAARHAGATRIEAHVRTYGGAVEIRVSDDGHGFPFEGTYDLAALDELRRGPVTLKERVASLGGNLSLETSKQGTTIDIRL